jgi:NAD(P)-dependent dehydrogenase (short-subunit alcohol dehydrogenase family)
VLRRVDEYQMDVFRRVLEVNLVGTMRACVAAHELLVATQGSIVNVGSMFSFFGSGHAPAYGASKAAVVQLTKSLAASFAPHVRVNAVAPGWIRTAMTSPLRKDPEAERRIISRTPAGRWGEPADIVGPVLWLASRAAAFVTGAVVPVDGGYSSV